MVRGTALGLGFRCLLLKNEHVVASDMFRAEARNAFWKYVRVGLLPIEQAETLIGKALALVDEFVPLEENAAESFAEAVRQDHPVYDLFYATLARRNAATLFSADKKLVALCERMGINCVCEVEF
nr:type II toxin-antitoxin system VapC family toxin [Raoultibacter phocaeensis]